MAPSPIAPKARAPEACYELGPIRPPSEAYSLLIRLTRNCPWNRCAFCHTYRRAKYSVRSADDVLADVRGAREIADEIDALSKGVGDRGELGEATLRALPHTPAHRNVAGFLYRGGRTVFLQDADPLARRREDVIKILEEVRIAFPGVDRITTYCRSATAARIGADGFRELAKAGLNRVHIGMESGSDAVLSMINKGATAEVHVQGGRAIKEAGLELSEYVMPGLGGKKLTEDHARESAAVLNRIGPDFVRLRTLAVLPGTELDGKVQSGELERLGDDGIAREIRLFVECLQGPVRLESDHILNLLEDLRGDLPAEKPAMLEMIDAYLALDDVERLNFVVGRRMGVYRNLQDRHGPMRSQVDEVVKALGISTLDQADEAVWELLKRFV